MQSLRVALDRIVGHVVGNETYLRRADNIYNDLGRS
jgi:hypothetical protein